MITLRHVAATEPVRASMAPSGEVSFVCSRSNACMVVLDFFFIFGVTKFFGHAVHAPKDRLEQQMFSMITGKVPFF